jgi:drug/metabolite transporter, DME family
VRDAIRNGRDPGGDGGFLWSLQGLVFRQIDAAEPWAILFWRSLGMVPVLLAFLVWRGAPVAGCAASASRGSSAGSGSSAPSAARSIRSRPPRSPTPSSSSPRRRSSPRFLAWLVLGERTRPETWGAIALALVGIFVMVRHGLSGGALAGNAAALVSALGFAVFTVSLRWRGVTDALPSVLSARSWP